jgi:hypothetical protein
LIKRARIIFHIKDFADTLEEKPSQNQEEKINCFYISWGKLPPKSLLKIIVLPATAISVREDFFCIKMK